MNERVLFVTADGAARSPAPGGPLLAGVQHPPGGQELENVVRYAANPAAGEVVTVECLPPPVDPPGGSDELEVGRLVRSLLDAGEADIYRRVMAQVDRVVLTQVLRQVGGNQVQASGLLGISRTTLRARLASADRSERERPGRLFRV